MTASCPTCQLSCLLLVACLWLGGCGGSGHMSLSPARAREAQLIASDPNIPVPTKLRLLARLRHVANRWRRLLLAATDHERWWQALQPDGTASDRDDPGRIHLDARRLGVRPAAMAHDRRLPGVAPGRRRSPSQRAGGLTAHRGRRREHCEQGTCRYALLSSGDGGNHWCQPSRRRSVAGATMRRSTHRADRRRASVVGSAARAL